MPCYEAPHSWLKTKKGKKAKNAKAQKSIHDLCAFAFFAL
jgi:hypothetical protein